MIQSKSSQYAVRALMALASRPEDGLCQLEEIAQKESIPKPFLAKVLQRLAKKKLVRSTKGKKGGFALNVPSESLTLLMVLDAVDEISQRFNECILGKGECLQLEACPLHEYWKVLKEKQREFLQTVTIADMARMQLQPSDDHSTVL